MTSLNPYKMIKPYIYNLILEPLPVVLPFPRTCPLPVALAWGSDILQRENYGSEMLYRRGRRLLYRENFPQFAATSCRGEGELFDSSKRRMLYFLADFIVLSIVGALLSCFVCLIYRWLRKNGTCIYMHCTLSGGGIYSISADQDISQGPTHVIVYL